MFNKVLLLTAALSAAVVNATTYATFYSDADCTKDASTDFSVNNPGFSVGGNQYVKYHGSNVQCFSLVKSPSPDCPCQFECIQGLSAQDSVISSCTGVMIPDGKCYKIGQAESLRFIGALRLAQKVADHTKYHQEPKGIWAQAKKWLTVNPEISSGVINHHQYRTIPPGSRTEPYVQPISKSSDIAENPYYKRDVRRAYPRTSQVSQNDLAQLLISSPDMKSLPNPDEPQTKALAQVKDAPETLDLAQVIAAVPAAHSPFNGLPPTPPSRPNPLTQTQGAPIKEGAYFPMRLFN